MPGSTTVSARFRTGSLRGSVMFILRGSARLSLYDSMHPRIALFLDFARGERAPTSPADPRTCTECTQPTLSLEGECRDRNRSRGRARAVGAGVVGERPRC